MTTYHELPGTARYEYRVLEGDKLSGWQDAGAVSPSCLDQIVAGLDGADWWEVRTVVSLIHADTGIYAGTLILEKFLTGQQEAA